VPRNELRRFAGFRPVSAGEELEEANRTPYPWERERARIRAMYDIERTELALAVLRDKDCGGGVAVCRRCTCTGSRGSSQALSRRSSTGLSGSSPPGCLARVRAPGDADQSRRQRGSRPGGESG
jgi:hypothetical protein